MACNFQSFKQLSAVLTDIKKAFQHIHTHSLTKSPWTGNQCNLLLMQLYHHLCNRWIIVREKQAFFFIQCPDSVHITCVQSKIKDIDIFFHTLLVGGFWDYHDIALQKETQSDLDRKSTRLNSSHIPLSRMPSSA